MTLRVDKQYGDGHIFKCTKRQNLHRKLGQQMLEIEIVALGLIRDINHIF